MLSAFHAHIERYNLLAKNARVLVAVSGGRDSMVLADLFRRSGYEFALAHANFQLRGAASDGDEELVKAWAYKHGIPLFSTRFDTETTANEQGISTQMAARDLRYRWFEDLCTQEGFTNVATAHHRQDALESTIINLTRGTGHAGMAGISARSGNRIRPLLFATRKDIDAYTAQHGIAWREDASNAETKYRRNFVRHEIIPQLETINPNLLETYSNTWERLEGANQLLSNFMDQWLQENLVCSGSDVHLSIKQLSEQVAPAVILYHWLHSHGFSYTVLADLTENLAGISGRHWDSATHRLLIDREVLWLSPLPQYHDAIPWPISSPTLNFPEGSLQRTRVSATDEIPRDPHIAWLDVDMEDADWVVRPWHEGDWFVPLGMQGKKKVSDFLIDRKIPLNLKNRVWVMEIDGDIAWVIGHRIDDRYKISPQTQSVVQLTFVSV